MPTVWGVTIAPGPHQETRDNFYSPQDAFLFRETFHLAEHFTVTNGDVTRVEFVRGGISTSSAAVLKREVSADPTALGRDDAAGSQPR